MSLQTDLIEIERRLWTGGPDAYRAHVDEECLVAFTEMAGRSSREDLAASVGDGPRWGDPEIRVEGLIAPTPDCAVVSYRATAQRGAEETYHALVSSGYVKRGDDWKLMFHHQTPLHEDS